MDDHETATKPPTAQPAHRAPAARSASSAGSSARSGGCSASIDIAGGVGEAGADRWLVEHARAAVGHLGAAGEVRVRVVNDAQMAAAHERYSGIPGTTDVLTFDLAGEPGVLDVDILVCVDEARRQAAARGHSVERELLLYVVHGVLHCLGHDDHDEAGAAAMHAREDEILGAIGVGATYAPRPRNGVDA